MVEIAVLSMVEGSSCELFASLMRNTSSSGRIERTTPRNFPFGRPLDEPGIQEFCKEAERLIKLEGVYKILHELITGLDLVGIKESVHSLGDHTSALENARRTLIPELPWFLHAGEYDHNLAADAKYKPMIKVMEDNIRFCLAWHCPRIGHA